MKYLLDTDHITFLQRRSGPEYAVLAARMAQHALADFAYSIVSFHEQVLGGHASIVRSRRRTDVLRGYALLLDILQVFMVRHVLPFDTPAAAVFDNLQAQRIRVSTMDLRIASIALSRGLIVLTRNRRDFGRVPGLVSEDWTI